MLYWCWESSRIHGKVRSPRGHLILSAKDLDYAVCRRPAGRGDLPASGADPRRRFLKGVA